MDTQHKIEESQKYKDLWNEMLKHLHHDEQAAEFEKSLLPDAILIALEKDDNPKPNDVLRLWQDIVGDAYDQTSY